MYIQRIFFLFQYKAGCKPTIDDDERNAIIDDVVSVDFVSSTMDGIAIGNRDSLKQFLHGAHAAFEDYKISVLDSAKEGHRVWLRLRGGGRHVGSLMGVELSGRRISVGAVVILEVADGRIVHEWQLSDIPSLTQQLRNGAELISGNTEDY